jgi:hypothetical protein
MQANRIGLPHLEHGRIPISARLYSGFGWIDDMMLPCSGGSFTDLSVADNCPIRGGDGASLAPNTNAGLVNIDHYRKLKPACTSKVRISWSIWLTSEKLKKGGRETTSACISANENKSIIAGTSHRLTLFAACLQKGRKTQ